jgi:tetratricopeptide (TPR) repeat protein
VNYERALELFERVADTSFELNVRQSLATIHFELGHAADARDLADRTIMRATEVGDDHWSAVAQVVRARVFLSEQRADEALRLAKQAERVLDAAGDQLQRADALRVMGAANEALANPRRADRFYGLAIDLLKSLGDRADMAVVATEYAKVLRARGDIDRAFDMLELAGSHRTS